MLIDPLKTAQLVTREIRNGEREGTPTKIALARRTYPTSPSDLWDALTNQDRLPRWFAPVTGDLRKCANFRVACILLFSQVDSKPWLYPTAPIWSNYVRLGLHITN